MNIFQSIPFTWVIMTRRKIKDYTSIFQYISKTWPLIVPETIVSDFERALHTAAVNVFGCKIRGCFFHYSQVS